MYPTQEQAAAAAMAISEVGESVSLHQPSCNGVDGVGCDCQIIRVLRTPEGWRFEE